MTWGNAEPPGYSLLLTSMVDHCLCQQTPGPTVQHADTLQHQLTSPYKSSLISHFIEGRTVGTSKL